MNWFTLIFALMQAAPSIVSSFTTAHATVQGTGSVADKAGAVVTALDEISAAIKPILADL